MNLNPFSCVGIESDLYGVDQWIFGIVRGVVYYYYYI